MVIDDSSKLGRAVLVFAKSQSLSDVGSGAIFKRKCYMDRSQLFILVENVENILEGYAISIDSFLFIRVGDSD
jgi:hypothetical protein